jgi:hypothetical protein
MATTTSVLRAGMPAIDAVPSAGRIKRRRIDPQSGRALVILGHAIEYLADEFVHEGGTFTANRGQVDAIQLLMAQNRDIYMACPEVPTFRQWLRSRMGCERKQTENEGKLASGLSHSEI